MNSIFHYLHYQEHAALDEIFSGAEHPLNSAAYCIEMRGHHMLATLMIHVPMSAEPYVERLASCSWKSGRYPKAVEILDEWLREFDREVRLGTSPTLHQRLPGYKPVIETPRYQF